MLLIENIIDIEDNIDIIKVKVKKKANTPGEWIFALIFKSFNTYSIDVSLNFTQKYQIQEQLNNYT